MNTAAKLARWILVLAVGVFASGCSGDMSPAVSESMTAARVLAAPVGKVTVDGKEITMVVTYRAGPVDEPLVVIATITDRDAEISHMWVVSVDYFVEVKSPAPSFNPRGLAVQHETALLYRAGLEFVAAVGITDSSGRVITVRSELTKLIEPPPLPSRN